MTVRDDDGGYRPLDQRTLAALAEADTWRSGLHGMRKIEDANRRREEAIERDFSNHIADVAREHRKQIRKELDQHIGAINVPMQDLMVPEEAPQRHGAWLGARRRHPFTGHRNPRYVRAVEV